jgi:histidine ammonia-lyase
LEYRAPLQPGQGVSHAVSIVRQHVPVLTVDRAMSREVENLTEMIRQGRFDALL